MSTLRIIIVTVMVSLFALWAFAQPSDTGPVPFPQVTNTNINDCSGYPGSVPGPGGNVYFVRGGFYQRNGTIYLGTNTTGGSCFGEINILFAPLATDINFTLTNFAPQIIQVNGVNYNLARDAVVGVTVPGPAAGLSIRAGIAFAISNLVITQHPVEQSFVRFDLSSTVPPTSDQTKILISKAIWDIGYPSAAQIAPDSSGNPQVRIAGTLLDAVTGQPKSGPVYLRIEDPPDTAPYRGGDAHQNDNELPPAVLNSTTVQADAQGRFEATMSIRSRTAGNNYQIVGATDANFGCNGGVCPRSAVFTLWKRVYVEDTSMLRASSFLAADAPAGQNTITVADPSPFTNLAPGTPLLLIHARNGAGDAYLSEQVTFGQLIPSGGKWLVQTQTPLRHDYYAAANTPFSSPSLPFNVEFLSDALGVDGAAFSKNMAYFAAALNPAFVETKSVIDPVQYAPLLRNIELWQQPWFAKRWFKHQQLGPAPSFVSTSEPNIIHSIGAATTPIIRNPDGSPRIRLGLTVVQGGTNYSFVFVESIEQLTLQPFPWNGRLRAALILHKNSSAVNGETSAHELVHIWERSGGYDGEGHCLAQAFQGHAMCLMHGPLNMIDDGSLDDGGVDMHYLNHGADSEYMDIRRALDPFPQQ